MKYFEKHPMTMLAIGVLGVSLSAIFVKFSQAPSAVTAAYRLIWTLIMMSPVIWLKKENRQELFTTDPRTVRLCIVSGIFLAMHFTLWFESLKHTSVASSTSIGCTEVIWVAIGFCLFLKGKLSGKAVLAIAVAVYTLIGRIARSNTSTSIYTYIVYSVCAATLLIFTMVQGYFLTAYGLKAVIVGFLLALFCTIMGHSVFSWCLKYLSPAFVAAAKLCEPVIAAVLAIFLFQEIPGGNAGGWKRDYFEWRNLLFKN